MSRRRTTRHEMWVCEHCSVTYLFSVEVEPIFVAVDSTLTSAVVSLGRISHFVVQCRPQ